MVSLHNNTLVTKTMAQWAEVPVTGVCLPEPTNGTVKLPPDLHVCITVHVSWPPHT